MADVVQTLRSHESGTTPAALLEGQLAVNIPDKIIWIGNSTGVPTIVFDAANVGVSDHTLLSNIGVATHAEIDIEIAKIAPHIADTNNPHAVTATQVGAAPTVHTHTLADVTDSGTMAAEDDVATADGIEYLRVKGGWTTEGLMKPTDVQGGQGITTSYPGDGTVIVNSSNPTSIKSTWLWNVAVTGDPGVGYMLGDTADGATVAALSFSFEDSEGNDVSDIVALMKTGDQLQMLRDNLGDPAYSVWELTADPVDLTTYASVPASILFDSHPSASPAQDEIMNVQWTPQSEQLPPIAHQHDHTTDLTNVGVNTHMTIDEHLADITGNPHNVTYDNIGGTQPAPAAHALGSHSDVTLVTPANGQALVYNGTGSVWENQPLPSGVTSHSALTELEVDDHPQYHNDARGDVRYAPIAHDHDAGTF